MRRTYSWRATALVPRPMTRVPLLPASLLSTRPSYKSLDRLNRPLGTRFKNLVTWELRDPRAGQLAGVSATTHGDAKTSNAITDHDREIVITRSRSPHGTEALRDHDRGHVSPSVHICQYLSMCVNICHTDMCVNICHAGRQAATAAADPQARRDPEVEQTLLVFLTPEEHHPRMSRPRSLTRRLWTCSGRSSTASNPTRRRCTATPPTTTKDDRRQGVLVGRTARQILRLRAQGNEPLVGTMDRIWHAHMADALHYIAFVHSPQHARMPLLENRGGPRPRTPSQ